MPPDSGTAGDAAPLTPRAAWAMVLALCAGVALSQAFRTVGAIMASPLQADFHLSAQALGIFSGAFHFAFGAMQLFMGIGIDLHGVRRTVLVAFPVAIAGALLSAVSSSYLVLVAGQALIGVGCAPAFLVCTVFIARHFPPARFATVSGMVLAIGGVGMLVTGTPLAWLVQAYSWRAGFLVLALAAALAWLAIWFWVHEPATASAGKRESVPEAIRQFGALFAMPHTLGIMVLGAVTYAAFISLRGLWLGPLMMERHGYSLVQSGNVALAVSVISLVGAPLFGRLDRSDAVSRRRWILVCGLGYAGLFALIAVLHSAWLDIAGMVLIGVLSGFIVWQYADVRGAYPATLTGRAMAVFTMAMFLGVALMQWGTGVAASIAAAHGADPLTAVLATIAALLVAGIAAFAWLPAPKNSSA
ncbi:putative MFS family arabinose efflux permease [Variovorax guangxiensis]|uniref:Putative MFS family arabinose efflux permease n=2 Tax=Comamonadaceae TaxID=80864 RepID=A0A840G2C3_9BURK|nr:putative MFS family arabinose efflux permease [Variovorax guangxiensis]